MNMIVITESAQRLHAWYRAVGPMGFHPKGVVSAGLAFRYPGDLDLLGFRFDETGVQEFGRLPHGKFVKRFQGTLETLPADTTILIATDDDQEGDVVAFDAAQMIQAHAPSLLSRTVRVRAASMDPDDLRSAAEAAIAQAGRAPAEARGLFARMQRAAAPGRARAVLDRWIGGAYSYDAGAPCGRVKAAALGAVRLWSERPEALRAIPEIGEIRLRVAADDGGAAFTARIPLHGPVPPDLESLLAWHHGAEVPGRIVTARPAGAAVAPRDGRAALLNTGDAIVEAARDHGLNVLAAMNGLEFGYRLGKTSYPRTAGRHVSEAVARRVVDFAQGFGVPDLPDSLQEWSAPAPGDGPHDALHPTRRLTARDVEGHFAAKRRRRGSTSIMMGIISERCFEAMRRNPLSWGSYRPDPGCNLTETEIATLEELVWTRSEAEPLHEAEPPGTELRWWPLDSIMVELMMSEEIGRPSTWASHGHALKVSGWLEPGRDGSPPTLSPRGRDVLSRLPPEAADPETSRHIQRILEDVPCGPDGTLDAPLPQVIAERIDAARAAFEGMDARLRAEMRRDDARLARTHRCRDEAQARPQDEALAAAVQIADAAAALGLCGAQDDGGAPSDATDAEEHGSVEAAQASADGATTLEPHIAQSRRSSAALLETLRRSNLARREATEAEAANRRAAQAPDGANSKSVQRGDAADMPGPAPLALDPGPLTAPDGATATAGPHTAAPEGWADESPADTFIEAPDGWPGDATQAPVDALGNSPDPAAQEGWPAESPDDASIEAPDGWPGDAAQTPIGAPDNSPDPAAQEGRPAESPDDASIEAPDGWPGDAAQTPIGAPDNSPDPAAQEGWSAESRDDASIEAPDGRSDDAAQTPIDAPDNSPDPAAQEGWPAESPAESPDDASIEAPDGWPGDAALAPVDALGNSPDPAAQEGRPAESPDDASIEAPDDASIEAPDGWPGDAAQTPIGAPDNSPDPAAQEGRPAESPDDASIEAPDGWPGDAAQTPIGAPDNSPDPAAQEGRPAESPDDASIEAPDGWPGDAALAPVDALGNSPDPAALEGWPAESPDGASIEAPDGWPDAVAQTSIGAPDESPDDTSQDGWSAESRDDAFIEAPDGWSGDSAQTSNDAPDNSPDPAAQEGLPAEPQDGAHAEAPSDWPGASVQTPVEARDDTPDDWSNDWPDAVAQAGAAAGDDHSDASAPALYGAANKQPAAADVPPHAPESPGIADGDPDSVDIPAPQECHIHHMEEHQEHRPEAQKIVTALPEHRERQAPDLPDQAPRARTESAPEPDAQGAHGQETDGREPHDAAAAHGHAAEPVGHVVRDMAPVESGFVTERLFENGGRPVVILEFYDHDGAIEFMEARDDAGNIEQLKYDAHTETLQPVAPGDESADPRMRWRARRPKPKPPEPDYDCDDDYDYDCCPDM